jgi:hypothetical protein
MTDAGTAFEFLPRGPFDLSNQNRYFGGWPTLHGDPDAIVMSFPVEGWKGSAAVVLRQSPDGQLRGVVYGDAAVAEKARAQALASHWMLRLRPGRRSEGGIL